MINLDFDKTNLDDRLEVVNEQINSQPHLSARDIFNAANYILWANKGEDSKKANIILNSAWSNKDPVSSLDQLKEDNPTIDNLIKETPVRYTFNKTPFDRQKALESYPGQAAELTRLYKEIDELALALGDPDSEKLNKKFESSHAPEERAEGRARIEALRRAYEKCPRQKLKDKKRLVELRTEQYEIAPPDGRKRDAALTHPARHSFFNDKKTDFDVYPNPNPKVGKVAEPADYLDLYQNEDLGKRELRKQSRNLVDLFDREQFIQVILGLGQIREFGERAEENHDTTNGFPQLAELVSFWVWGGLRLFLKPEQIFILNEKMEGKQNDMIKRSLVNHGGHEYQTNYISTIFRQRIIDNIWKFMTLYVESNNAAARKDYDSFKTCDKCGRLLYKCKETFPVSKKSADGFGNTCKFCRNFRKKKENTIDFDFEKFEEDFRNGFDY